jgi:hypothetical protein
MSLSALRPMRDGQEDAVAAMVRQLPKDLGLPVVPKLTGEGLRKARGLVSGDRRGRFGPAAGRLPLVDDILHLAGLQGYVCC